MSIIYSENNFLISEENDSLTVIYDEENLKLVLQEKDIPFKKIDFFVEKEDTETINYLNKILDIDLNSLYTKKSEQLSPKTMLLKMKEAMSKKIVEPVTSNTEYPYEIFQDEFICPITGNSYTLLFADYNEKCISFYVNPVYSQQDAANSKIFSQNYGDKLKASGGLFNFKLKGIPDLHTYSSVPGWCFSKNIKDYDALMELLSTFTENTEKLKPFFTKKPTFKKVTEPIKSTSQINEYLNL